MRRDFIVKSNALIEARYRLSLQESHVILWLLDQIEPNDEDFKEHELSIKEFAEFAGLKLDGQYSELQKTTENLMKRILKIRKEGEEKLLQVAWLSSALYQFDEGTVILRFDPALKPYLLQLKSHFTKIDIVDTLKLRSIYAIRIYELLTQYAPIGKREITVEELRSYCDIDSEEYKLYGHLKQRVIDNSKREINAKTGYDVDYREIKKSRRVTALEWTFKKKTNFEKMQHEKADFLRKELRSKSALIDKLTEYGFSKRAANQLIANSTEDRVKEAINAVDVQLSKGKVKNPAGWIKTALTEQWKTN